MYRYTDIQNESLVNYLKLMAEETDKENVFALEYSVSEISHWIYTNFGPPFEVQNSVLVAKCFFFLLGRLARP